MFAVTQLLYVGEIESPKSFVKFIFFVFVL